MKRLDQESKDQMKEIERSIAAKKQQVGDVYVVHCLTTTKTPCSAITVYSKFSDVSQVMDKLLGYVTKVDFKAGASHM